ncbi:MAG: UvrB/UvrC motif-containing protein [Clostridia bacterium]|nr:UvrB/UvrC motif-containing protein [Clostridia bacterium]MDD4386632.1 UvrB/UvrC motif-containing protein [Clostridia bacterium]
MKCQSCKKEEAIIKYYENSNDEKREIMLCSNCAKKLNLIDFPNMLSYFFSSYSKELIENKYTKKVCDKCSYTFENYLKTGLFGCPECYSAFNDRIDTLLSRIHGKNRHVNTECNSQKKITKKTYMNIKDKNQNINISSIIDMNKLKKLLDLSIKEEKYEDAAKIRDRIKDLE